MPASLSGLRRQIGVDIQEAGAGNVALEVELSAAAGIRELPATVDELVAQTYQFAPGDVGNGTDAGWIT
jgi:hypothetical protein